LQNRCYHARMKLMKCKDLGGACDELIGGNTPEEMGDNCKAHAMLMIQKGDEDHIEAMRAMQDMSPGEFAHFWADFRRNFEEADEM
jgi:hypothetical protein